MRPTDRGYLNLSHHNYMLNYKSTIFIIYIISLPDSASCKFPDRAVRNIVCGDGLCFRWSELS